MSDTVNVVKSFSQSANFEKAHEMGLGQAAIDKITSLSPDERLQVLSSPGVVFEMGLNGYGEQALDMIEAYGVNERARIFSAQSSLISLGSRHTSRTWALMADFSEDQFIDALEKGGPTVTNFVVEGALGHAILDRVETWRPENQVRLLSRNKNYTALGWTEDLAEKRDALMDSLKAKCLWVLDGKPAPRPVFILT